MGLVLYHYVHCPYCIRVRLSLGFLGLNYESRVLDYADRTTPEKLTGKKMLPILTVDGTPMNESLDIIRDLDKKNQLQAHGDLSAAEVFILSVNNPVHSLAMPYWIYTPEFSLAAREYFIQQKEAKRGPFKELVRRAEEFRRELAPRLEWLCEELGPFFQSDKLRLQDIMIAAHLWGLYVVPEFQFPPSIHAYLQEVKSQCHFNYHQDFWR